MCIRDSPCRPCDTRSCKKSVGSGRDWLSNVDKVEILLRFIGYSKTELEQMEEKEVWRKAFSAIDLVREMIEGLAGGGAMGTPPPPSPPGFDPMAAYNSAGPE